MPLLLAVFWLEGGVLLNAPIMGITETPTKARIATAKTT
ncbi:hypothetical protein GXM_04844 [Nostoc sphaeroides CCNUC1]|uniref:Uncharacterized protein n=1 Tax=Nostoc sphaeroides CCNUC1 TaxID=2653204 RepID=A0A5P8W406_9NOSO|nr:hypothetical protein GXM_04844 [Nostoc sphaeroides CCNUC1]